MAFAQNVFMRAARTSTSSASPMFFIARAAAPTFAAPRGRTNTTRMLCNGIGRDRSILRRKAKRDVVNAVIGEAPQTLRRTIWQSSMLRPMGRRSTFCHGWAKRSSWLMSMPPSTRTEMWT